MEAPRRRRLGHPRDLPRIPHNLYGIPLKIDAGVRPGSVFFVGPREITRIDLDTQTVTVLRLGEDGTRESEGGPL